MDRTLIVKDGVQLRAIECPTCSQTIIHPVDEQSFHQYKNLRGKTYNVKLRIIGNSHAISIPKEIVEFMHHEEKLMNDMVRLCFEDMRRLRLDFGDLEDERN